MSLSDTLPEHVLISGRPERAQTMRRETIFNLLRRSLRPLLLQPGDFKRRPFGYEAEGLYLTPVLSLSSFQGGRSARKP
jgi:hypothetical protein